MKIQLMSIVVREGDIALVETKAICRSMTEAIRKTVELAESNPIQFASLQDMAGVYGCTNDLFLAKISWPTREEHIYAVCHLTEKEDDKWMEGKLPNFLPQYRP